MDTTTLLRMAILMVVLKVGTPVVIKLTIDGTTHRIEIIRRKRTSETVSFFIYLSDIPQGAAIQRQPVQSRKTWQV